MTSPLLPKKFRETLAKNPHYRKREKLRQQARKEGKSLPPGVDPTTQKPLG